MNSTVELRRKPPPILFHLHLLKVHLHYQHSPFYSVLQSFILSLRLFYCDSGAECKSHDLLTYLL